MSILEDLYSSLLIQLPIQSSLLPSHLVYYCPQMNVSPSLLGNGIFFFFLEMSLIGEDKVLAVFLGVP